MRSSRPDAPPQIRRGHLRAAAAAAPRNGGRQTVGELRELQRLAFATISRPLSRAGGMQRTWRDGRATSAVVEGFIKPNDRLSSLERIEIYNKQYWFRLLDCLYDDYPGLRAILGDARFSKLRIAYLERYPSASFTLRNLGSRLVAFLGERSDLIAQRTAMCLDMARFEWAQVVAFDGPSKPPLVPDDLLGRNPAKLRLSVQPYLTLLEMGYPLDDFVISVKRQDRALRSEASNAMEEEAKTRRSRRVRLPRASKTFVGVHRHNNDLYYRRLEPSEFGLLRDLAGGASVAEACEAAISASDETEAADWPVRIREWFQTWTELGWLCKRTF